MHKLNILFIHPDLTLLGGAEKVLIHMIHALKGSNISLLSNRWNPNELSNRFDIEIPRIRWIKCQSFLPRFSHLKIFQWIKYSNTINEIVQKISKDYDIMIETQQVYITPPSKITLINYMHYPYLLVPPPETNSMAIRFYYAISRYALSERIKRIDLFLTNSPFTGEIIKAYLGTEPTIVYPPVEVKKFFSNNDWEDRENKVINVGTFMPFKQQLKLLKVAKSNPNIKFVLIGLLEKQHEKYHQEIMRNKPKNVTLLHDVSIETLKEELSTSKAYIHLCPEHFGISIIEAIAAGCAPMVYYVGGPAEILGNSAIQWSKIEELTNSVRSIIENKEKWKKIVKGARNKIDSFKSSVFEQKIRGLILKYA